MIEARSANCLSPGAGKWERAGVNLDLAKFSISTLGGRVTSCGEVGWGNRQVRNGSIYQQRPRDQVTSPPSKCDASYFLLQML